MAISHKRIVKSSEENAIETNKQMKFTKKMKTCYKFRFWVSISFPQLENISGLRSVPIARSFGKPFAI